MSGSELLPAAPLENLHGELRDLIAGSRERLAATVNAEITLLYWRIGQRLATEVLGGERAQYGAQLMDRLGERLAGEFGRGFEAKNLRRMVQFAQAFADAEIVASLMRQLSWTHFLQLLPLKTEPARRRYAHRPDPVRRVQSRTGRTTADAQGRHHRRRVLDRATAEGGTGATIARGAGRGARAAGAAARG